MWENEPLERVFIAVWMIDDEDRRKSLLEEGISLRNAFLHSQAVNSPQMLNTASRRYDIKLSTPLFAADVISAPAVVDAIAQLRLVGRI